MVKAFESAGRPVSGGPLFCARIFFIITSLLAAFYLCPTANAAQNANASKPVDHRSHQCALAPSAVSEPAKIHAVTDGDTVVLADQRKVRVIGINAPELSKKSERTLHDEAFAAQALIENIIEKNPAITLVLGDEPKDRYGRVLAHVLFQDGSNFATELLARGLAAASAVSPNTRCADYYQRIETAARNQQRGVWKDNNNPWFATDVPVRSIQGFHLITDRVEEVSLRKKRWIIRLSRGVTVSASTSLLSKQEALALNKQTVEVRGWFGRINGSTGVRLHHRSNLTVNP